MLKSSSNATSNSAQLRDELPRQRVVYVAPDCTDSAVKKRAHGFVGLGHQLVSFSFRRDRYNVGYQPDWPNVEIGKSEERRLAARVLICMKALAIIYLNRRTWRKATMLYVRNLDLALLALAGKAVTRCRAPLVYEVLDIHPTLLKRGARGAILRWLERRVLKHCKLLVVSSPAFLRNYFQPVQDFQGEAFVLENKWPRENVFKQMRQLKFDLDDDKPVWTIGWFGNIRCEKSLQILTEVADALPDRVRIYLRGSVSLLGKETLHRAMDGRANMAFEGEYDAPEDLPRIYSQVHFNWCADFSDGDNSLWLLPNRVYEGGYFGIPAIAITGHETGRFVQERRLGLTLEPPFARRLKDLLVNMTGDQYRQLRKAIEEMPSSHFADTGDLAEMMRVAPLAPTEKHAQAKTPGIL